MGCNKLSPLQQVHVIDRDSTDMIVRTLDGRTGDRHEFHLTGSNGLRATVDNSSTVVSIWATEPALPKGTYDPSVGVPSRHIRITISLAEAESLRDQLRKELRKTRLTRSFVQDD